MFEIKENETWWRGGMWVLLKDGQRILTSDNRRELAHLAMLMTQEAEA